MDRQELETQLFSRGVLRFATPAGPIALFAARYGDGYIVADRGGNRERRYFTLTGALRVIKTFSQREKGFAVLAHQQ